MMTEDVTNNLQSDILENEGHSELILDTFKKRLPSLDSQRMVSALDELIFKLEYVTMLPYAFQTNNYCPQSLLELLNRYSFILESNKCLPPLNLSDEDLHGEERLDPSVTKKISDITKDITRYFKSYPYVKKEFENTFPASKQSGPAKNIIACFVRLRNQLFERLLLSPCEEIEHQGQLVALLLQDRQSQVELDKLESELLEAKAAKERNIQARNDVIQCLKTSSQTLLQEANVVNKKTLNSVQQLQINVVKASRIQRERLGEDIVLCEKQFKTDVTVHRAGEANLRRRKFKIEMEVANWIQKYDNDISIKQAELCEMSEAYEEDKRQLEELQRQYNNVKIQYDEIISERQLDAERKEKYERKMKAMMKAATMIQALWRSYRCRKALRAKANKKNKKKKGKRKKK